jgi:putative transposase
MGASRLQVKACKEGRPSQSIDGSRLRGGCFFFTVCLADRRATTLVDHVTELQDAWRWTQARLPFSSPAWVVLPDHIHCIWKLPPDDDNYALRWSLLKRHFTKSLRKEMALLYGNRKGEQRDWQRRFWEHAIRDERDLENHFTYIHANPVRHGYAKTIDEWPHSSFHKRGGGL